MKYENFPKVVSLVDSIKKHNEIIQILQQDDVSVKLLNGPNYTIMTIGTWDSCEHSLSELAATFKKDAICYYSQKLADLHAELAEL